MASGNRTFHIGTVFLPSNTEPSVTPLYAHWQAALIPSDAYLPPILFQTIIDFNSSLLVIDWENLYVHAGAGCPVGTASFPCFDLIGPLNLSTNNQESKDKRHYQQEQTYVFEVEIIERSRVLPKCSSEQRRSALPHLHRSTFVLQSLLYWHPIPTTND